MVYDKLMSAAVVVGIFLAMFVYIYRHLKPIKEGESCD